MPTSTPPTVPATPASGRAEGTLRLLARADLEQAATVLARSFDVEPGGRALFPDPGLRRRYLELGGRLQIDAALPYASVHGLEIDGRLAGVAVWHPPHVTPRPFGALARSRRELLGQDRSDVVDPNPARRAAKLDQVAARIRYEQHLLKKAGLDPARCTAMAADRVIGKN